MLFLDTLKVDASVSNTSISKSYSLYFEYDLNSGKFVIPTGYLNNGSGTISGSPANEVSAGFYHFKVPLNINGYINGSPSTTDYIAYVLYMSSFSGSVYSNSGTVYNACLTDSTGKLICVGVNGSGGLITNFGQVSDLWSTEGKATMNYYLEFDASFTSDAVSDRSVSVSLNTILYIQQSSVDEVPTIKVSDVQANQNLEDINTNAEQTNQNTAGILSKITDFFGTFFENLIGIFVPEDGYFSEWFNKVNILLSEKLGMLYAPFDLVISTLQAIYSADSTDTGIPFPGIKWEDTWLVEPFTFTFASLGDSFDDLRDKVYFATDTVLVLTFLMLLQSKVKLILEGHE